MTRYEYQAIPFIGSVKSGQGADIVANQLTSAIDSMASQGWEFHQLADVNIEVQPGCLAKLFGASVSYITFNQLIFRRAAA